MLTLKEQAAAARKKAADYIAGLKADGHEITDAEVAEAKSLTDAANALQTKAASREEFDAISAQFSGTDTNEVEFRASEHSKSLGEHFVKHAGDKLKAMKGISGASVSAPEFKAATDVTTVGSVFGPTLTTIDRTIIQGVRPRLTIADLIGSGTIAGNAISYFVEGILEGAFTTVAEGGAKPQLHIADPTVVTDALKKIAGFTKFTDEMLEDLDFVVSEINNRLLYELAKFEETQILNGNGTGQNLLGLLNRTGVQVEARGTLASLDTAADAIFRGMTKISTGAGLDPDGIVIHPLDYQTLRLAKDGNGQYYGGGFFAGQYGNGTLQDQPPLWGLRTVVTPAVAAGTVLVGAFAQAATLYRKGGVRVESTNSHASDFTSNLVTTRVEERVALAVRRPSGLVKVTITPAA